MGIYCEDRGEFGAGMANTVTTDWLWMEEDELREQCWMLLGALFRSETQRLLQAVEIQRAVEYGYREGYADGTLRIPFAIKEGDAEGVVLH